MASPTLTKKEKKRNQNLMEDIINYCCQHEIFEEIHLYTNGHHYSSEPNSNAVECTTPQNHIYYDYGTIYIQASIEYSNDHTVTMTFEGPFYTMYNHHMFPFDYLEKDIINIADKYGLYPEQGYAWSLAFYD